MDLVVAILPHAQEADSDELVDAVVARGEGPPKPGCLDDAVLLLGSGVGETAQPGEPPPFVGQVVHATFFEFFEQIKSLST